MSLEINDIHKRFGDVAAVDWSRAGPGRPMGPDPAALDVLRLPLVDLEPKRFPPEPIKSPGAAIANLAILAKDQAEDEGDEPNPFVDFVARLPRRRRTRCRCAAAAHAPPRRVPAAGAPVTISRYSASISTAPGARAHRLFAAVRPNDCRASGRTPFGRRAAAG